MFELGIAKKTTTSTSKGNVDLTTLLFEKESTKVRLIQVTIEKYELKYETKDEEVTIPLPYDEKIAKYRGVGLRAIAAWSGLALMNGANKDEVETAAATGFKMTRQYEKSYGKWWEAAIESGCTTEWVPKKKEDKKED